jgi:hypothetical protein
VLDFDLVEVAVVVEGGRDGGENTLQLHEGGGAGDLVYNKRVACLLAIGD